VLTFKANQKALQKIMPSHFSTIGFPVEYQSDYEALVMKAVKHVSHIKVRSGSYVHWEEKNGAEIWVQQDHSGQLLV
jgi:hypothetical protein